MKYADLRKRNMQLTEALRDLVKWNGRRDIDTDELLPPEKQPKEIAHAMRLLNEGGAS